MATDEVGTLGPKDRPGVDVSDLRTAKNWAATAKPAPGAPVFSKPDLELPKKEELVQEKLFPVKLLRGYRPATANFQIGHYDRDDDGSELASITYEDPPEVEPDMDAGLVLKVPVGAFAMLPISEAKAVIRKGIAERADAIN